MLELLKIQGLGPKTIALLWSAFQVSDLAGVEQLAREGKLRELPRLSEKSEQKILKAIEDYRRISGRFLLDEADRTAEKLTEHLKHIKGIEKITPAGSLRRGRETVGDLDMLITGPCCVDDEQRAAADRRDSALPRHCSRCWRRATTRSASSCAAACRWTCACCRRNPTARRCSTSPARRTTTSRCASAR